MKHAVVIHTLRLFEDFKQAVSRAPGERMRNQDFDEELLTDASVIPCGISFVCSAP